MSVIASYLLGLSQLAGAIAALTLFLMRGVWIEALAITVFTGALLVLNVRLFGGLRDAFTQRIVSSFRRSPEDVQRRKP